MQGDDSFVTREREPNPGNADRIIRPIFLTSEKRVLVIGRDMGHFFGTTPFGPH